jgi:predicted RNA-binding Zn-ribbon protein involved in translation (DUF1610 family)
MKRQYCPICSAIVEASSRYPRFVCPDCASRASSGDGRLLEFTNTDPSGGFAARYADTGESYDEHECFIDGIRCRADEARFGGIVIEVSR